MNYRLILALLYSFLGTNVMSQSRLQINDNAFIVINASAKLVIENPNPNAVLTAGTGGNIITESEFNQVVWKTGTSTGTYIIPFTANTTFAKIPFTANVTGAGTGAGEIRFSTYSNASWDNNTYRPSDVTHMYDLNTGLVNNSNHVIDRFWIIDPLGYTTKPNAVFDFMYQDIEHSVASNVIVESNLAAQRFNSTTACWGDYLPQGSTNSATNTTSGVPVVAANFFRSWTLSEILNPLALDLVYFKTSCNDQTILFDWEIPVQYSVDHFEIEHYINSDYEVIGVIPFDNNSNDHKYAFETGVSRSGVFRLVEIDLSGVRKPLEPVNIECGTKIDPIISYNNENNSIFFEFFGEEDASENMSLFDASGRMVYSFEINIKQGKNSLQLLNIHLSSGYYQVRMKNGFHTLSKSFVNTY
jgi:hypothetical protein